MRTKALLLATALVIATNTVAMIGVFLNRSGEPDATIELTERELPLDRNDREESGLSLQLETATLWWGPWSRSEGSRDEYWFDKAKLEELGFDCSTPLDDPAAELTYRKARRREAFVVLEYEGDAWRERIAYLERELAKPDASEDYLRAEIAATRETSSRLMPIDAGLDPVALRTRYPDRGRNLIVRAVVGLSFLAANKESPALIDGHVLELLTDELYVPPAQRRVLEGFLATEQNELPKPDALPRYEVTLQFGSRHEPWLLSVSPHFPDGKTQD